jgi:hypothetical protein
MARTEMIQASPSVALAQPSTPPSSPSLLSSEHVVTLSIAQEFLDMVKAVVAMQIASSPAPKCTCSHTPPEKPIEATSIDLCLRTPCHTSPTDQASSQVVTTEHVQQFLDILKSLGTMQGPPPPPTKPSSESGEPKGRASRLEFKTINEVYVLQCCTSPRTLT